MNLYRICPYLIIMVCTGLASNAAASPWMRTSGESHFYSSLAYSTTDSYWDRDRNLIDSCQSSDFSTYLSYEYGYSYYHSLVAAGSIQANRCGDSSSNGIPELKLGVRGRLNVYRNGRTWQVNAIIPVQGDPDDPGKPGSGRFGLDAGVFFLVRPDPYKFIPVKYGDWSWNAGVTLWEGGAAHKLWGRIGWKNFLFGTSWRLGISLSGSLSFGGRDEADFDPAIRFKSNDSDSLGIGISFSKPIFKKTSFSVGIGQDIWGRNTSKNTDFSLSLSWTWED